MAIVLQVSWSFGFKQRALLNLSNKRLAFESQTLQVGCVWLCRPWLAGYMVVMQSRSCQALQCNSVGVTYGKHQLMTLIAMPMQSA
jgi:hypothetical protein